MRLNRVLLLAATISVMMFALVFTISCSGDDGKNGKNGAGCTAEPNGKGGYDVICGDEFLGILEGTADHAGKPGQDGQNGKNGSYCVIGNQTATSIEIKCNGEVAGTLDACEVRGLSDYELQVTCKNAEIHICRGEAPEGIDVSDYSEIFNPAQKLCSPSGAGLEPVGVNSNITCQGDGKKTFNKNTYYCGYKDEKATKRTALPKCHYSLEAQPNEGLDVSHLEKYNTIAKCTAAGGDVITHYSTATRSNIDHCENDEGEIVAAYKTETACEAAGSCYDSQYTTYATCIAAGEAWDWYEWVTANKYGYTGGSSDVNETYEIDGTGINKGRVIYDACYLNLRPLKAYGTGTVNGVLVTFDGIDEKTGIQLKTTEDCLHIGGDTLKVDGGYPSMFYPRGEGSYNREGWFRGDEDKWYPIAIENYDTYSGTYICVLPGQQQYCQYLSPRITVHPIVTSELCGGGTVNKDKWLGQYCGYLEKVNNKGYLQSVQTGLCDDYDENLEVEYNKVVGRNSAARGPNEDYFNAGYCTVKPEDRIEAKTSYRDEFFVSADGNFCGNGSKNKPNNGKWAKEYCGFSYKTVAGELVWSTDKDKVYNDICDDNQGPFEDQSRYAYCEVKFENRLSGFTTKQTSPCGTSGQPNKNTWQRQYCGYKKENSDGADKVFTGICDDGLGPNQNGFNKAEYCQARKDSTTFLSTFACELGADGKINENGWKGEYCGYASEDAPGLSKLTGACGDEGDMGPNSESFGGGYCQAIDKKGDMQYTSIFCGEDKATVNEGSWKGEYCGFSSETSARADKVYTGVCDEGGGPNEGGFNAGYCRVADESATGTEFSDALCGGATVNEGTWKGEYCYADDKVAACTGGRFPNLDKNSTDPFSVRCTYTKDDMICTESNLSFCDQDGCTDLGEGFTWDTTNNECLILAEAN